MLMGVNLTLDQCFTWPVVVNQSPARQEKAYILVVDMDIFNELSLVVRGMDNDIHWTMRFLSQSLRLG